MKITLARLSTKDLATLAQRTIASSKSGKYKITENQPLLTALEQAYAEYDVVYTKQAFSGKGKSVAEADEARDKVFSALKNFLWGYHQLSIAPNADKARELYEIIKTHGSDIDRQSYSTQTAQLKKLIEDLDKSENKAKLTTLGIRPEKRFGESPPHLLRFLESDEVATRVGRPLPRHQRTGEIRKK